MQVPPDGGMFVRDPAAARAQAIREKVALFQKEGVPIPEHLQTLLDGLPDGDDSAVELVDKVTGKLLAEVDVDDALAPRPVKSAPVKQKAPTEEKAPGYTTSDQPADPEPEHEAHVHVAIAPETTLSSSGDLSVQVVAEDTGAVLGTVEAPAPAPAKRGRPAKKVSPPTSE